MELEKVIKYALTLFTLILIPVYIYNYGIENFLWLSDIGLFLTVLALWFDSPLLMSMAAVGVMVVELAWCVEFFSILFFNINPIGFANYMFDSSYNLFLRGLSLFHVITPPIWVWYLSKYGYSSRALNYFTGLFWIILPITYLFTRPQANINWVFLPQINHWLVISQPLWVIILFIGFPILVFLPTHYLLTKIFRSAK